MNISYGDFIQIANNQNQTFLTCRVDSKSKSSNTVYNFSHRFLKSEEKISEEKIKEIQLPHCELIFTKHSRLEDKVNANSIWKIEAAEYYKGGFLKPNDAIRIKNLKNGYYLSIKELGEVDKRCSRIYPGYSLYNK